MKIRIAMLVAVSALALLPQARAQTAVNAGAVDIEASEMEILETDKRAIFRGDVVAKRPTDTIRCAEMVVYYVDVKQADGSSNTEVDKLDCNSSVTITTTTQTITGDLAVFQLRQNLLDVTGNVKVVQGQNRDPWTAPDC